MEKYATASLSNLNISPRKVRLVTDLVKGSSVVEALAQLQVTSKRTAPHLTKLIKSAVANAKEQGLNEGKLVIDNITVDKGRVLKRGLSRGRGRVTLVEKKQSHVKLVLKEDDKTPTPQFIIHEKPKVEKVARAPREERDKPKFEESKKEKDKKVKGPGFVKRFFQRKSI